ncbi:MAG: hypothetical protein U9Q33_01930 [Campylobacterota bacterium]|nr:hypothetical protein [Campylobacterota bacterium]
MRIIVTLFFIFVLSIKAVEISKSKVFSSSIIPNVLTTSFTLKHKAQNDNEIEKLFQKAINIAKKSDICKGGSYKIYPSYRYINNKRLNDGYNSYLDFNCRFQNINSYEKLISNIKHLNAKLTQNKIKYISTDQQKESSVKMLEVLAYKYAISYKKYLNEQFKDCKIKSISFSNSLQNDPIALKRMILSQDTTTTSPVKDEIKHKINVNYTFLCDER